MSASPLRSVLAAFEDGARSRTDVSMRATTFGVNARLTIERSRWWRGSSITIIEPKYSANSGVWSAMTILGLELKISG